MPHLVKCKYYRFFSYLLSKTRVLIITFCKGISLIDYDIKFTFIFIEYFKNKFCCFLMFCQRTNFFYTLNNPISYQISATLLPKIH